MALKAIHSIEQDPKLGCWSVEFTVAGEREDFVDRMTIGLFVDWSDGHKVGAILQQSVFLNKIDQQDLVSVVIRLSEFGSRRKRRAILEAANNLLRRDNA